MALTDGLMAALEPVAFESMAQAVQGNVGRNSEYFAMTQHFLKSAAAWAESSIPSMKRMPARNCTLSPQEAIAVSNKLLAGRKA